MRQSVQQEANGEVGHVPELHVGARAVADRAECAAIDAVTPQLAMPEARRVNRLPRGLEGTAQRFDVRTHRPTLVSRLDVSMASLAFRKSVQVQPNAMLARTLTLSQPLLYAIRGCKTLGILSSFDKLDCHDGIAGLRLLDADCEISFERESAGGLFGYTCGVTTEAGAFCWGSILPLDIRFEPTRVEPPRR